ncbi:PAS domain-containing protein [Acidaminobacter sp. JC074]|uniref:sigma-54 interaction domain-containing protein n=1 Tax=Acidaminobacter sp. JC074 TaxID=2530199 RepID=UPI001F103CEA|nr:sigma 54-interacting transcriptional regulator [Acidaminobacter sp. JC074]MCH4887201.1 PAS domain-containing protein [Acidaminobacter sp. JC074]
MSNSKVKEILKDLDIDNKNGVIDLLEDLNEGILIVDKAYNIIFYNDHLANIEFLDSENVIGKNLFEVFPDKSAINSTIYQCINTGTKVVDKLEEYFTYKGKQVSVINTTIPLYKDGEIIAALDLSKDLNHYNKLLKANFGSQSKLSTSGKTHYSFHDIISNDSEMKRTIERGLKAARQTSSVLIVGETGTGKELFAQSIHNESLRNHKPFIAINCAAIPETLMESILFGTAKGSFTGAVEKRGLFEQANHGTLLLDEINSLSIGLQAKLLRVLQEGTFRRIGGEKEIASDVRIIATSNSDLMDMVKDKTFRLDLYYRLSVITIEIPPLRDRKSDIKLLANHFLEILSEHIETKAVAFTDQVLNLYQGAKWKGNVRELRNVVESSMCLLDDETFISIEHTPRYLREEAVTRSHEEPTKSSRKKSLNDLMFDYEKSVILEALKNHGNNITKAAESLDISRQSMQYRMKRLGISKSDFVLIHKDDM